MTRIAHTSHACPLQQPMRISLRTPAALLLLLPTLSLAQTEVTTRPAVDVSYEAEAGRFHQLQRREGDDWVDVGLAVRGTGAVVRGFHPAGEYRLTKPSKKWVLVWADEFDGRTLDTSKWSREENNYGGGNNERQFYSTDPKYSFVKDGRLHIAVHRDAYTSSDGKTSPYTSARLRTLHRGDWTFGRFEVRAKVPSGQGIWPAVWMLPTESPYGGWAASGEIDILESRGSKVEETTGAIHFGGAWPRNRYLGGAHTFPGKNAAEAFHTYAVEWSADAITWSVDGETYMTRKKEEWSSEAAKDDPSAPFNSPFHLILNVAVDGGFFQGTDQKADLLAPDAFPQVFEIDYVRVHQWAE